MGTVKSFILAILVMTGIVIGLSTFYGSLYDQYDTNVKDISFMERTARSQQMLSNITQETSGTGFTSSLGFMIKGAAQTVTLLFNGLTIIQSMFTDMVGLIGVPQWAANTILAVITTVVTLAVLSVFVNREL